MLRSRVYVRGSTHTDEVDSNLGLRLAQLPDHGADDAATAAAADGGVAAGAGQPRDGADGVPDEERRYVRGAAKGALIWMYGSVAGAERALNLPHDALANGAPTAYRIAMAHLEALRAERDLGLGAAIAAVQALRSVERLLPQVEGAESAREQLALSIARLASRYIEPLQHLE